MPQMHYNIYFIPFEIRGPVYLEVLKKNINGISNSISFTVNRFSWKKLLFSPNQKNERRVIHIHWESNIYGSKYLLVSIVKMILRFSFLFLIKKLKGAKIVWTMHNLKSHDYPHPKSDELGRRIMWMLADKVLLHEKSFADSEKQKRKHKDIECIPPGNYIGIYGELWHGDRAQLRKEYGLEKDAIVLLALGAVRPYKVLEPVIEAVKEVSKRIPVQLLVVGRPSKEYGESLKKLADNDKSIVLDFNYFDDQDIPKIYGLADYSVLFYGESAIGSAAILLSLSYGVPVICRDFAVSELIIEGKNGFKFKNKEELIKIIEKLPEIKKFDPQNVMSTVANWNWHKMGNATRKAYISLYR